MRCGRCARFAFRAAQVQVAESYPATGVNAKHAAAFYLLLLTRLTRENLGPGRATFDKLTTIFQTLANRDGKRTDRI